MGPAERTRSRTRSRTNSQVSIPGQYESDHETTALTLKPPSDQKGKPQARYEVNLAEYPHLEGVTLPKGKHRITSIQDLRAMPNNEAAQWIRCWSEMIQNDVKIHEHTTQMIDGLNKDKQRYKQRALEARQALSIETQNSDDHKEELDQRKVQIERLERTISELEYELATERNHVAASWCQRGIGPAGRLAIENLDEYDAWEHGVREKLTTDAPMYLNNQQRFDYIISQMKGMLFRSMQKWIQSKNGNLTMEEIFSEVQHLMGISQRVTDAKIELQTIKMRYNESITEYYHRILSLWEYAQTPMDERITEFIGTITPSISTPLLLQKYTHINELVNAARNIQNLLKKISKNFPRQEKGSSPKPSRNSNHRGSTSNGGPAGARTNGGANLNAKFFPTSEKPAGWSGAWYDPDPRPKRLEDNERDIFARQGRCWACRGSGHRSSNECCPESKKR